MDNQKDLPLPETELPKPEKDLPLPEKELTSGAQNTASAAKPKKSKSKWIIVVLILLAALILAGAGGYFMLGRSTNPEEELPLAPEDEVVCTQEVKLCPDGETYVGREAPNCEFAACPAYEPGDEEVTPVEDELKNVEEITEEPLPTTTPAEIAE